MTTPASASDADSAHQASYGSQEATYGDFLTTGTAYAYDTGAHATTGAHAAAGPYAADPLFGDLPGGTAATGGYDATQWSTGSHQTLNQDPYAAQHHAAYDTGAYDTTAWSTDPQQLSGIPPQTGAPDVSGQWDTSAWLPADGSTAPADPTQQWEWGTQLHDSGTYDATQWNSGEQTSYEDAPHADTTYTEAEYADSAYGEADTTYGETEYADAEHGDYGHGDYEHPDYGQHPSGDDESGLRSTGEMPAVELPPLLDDQEETGPAPVSRVAARSAHRSRRRTPARRSALLTVAVPSACVMGVAGIAAASVSTLTGGDDTDTAAAAVPDAQPVKPSTANNKLDAQLTTLTAGADDFADRASRTQERIDLKAQQELEKKKAAAEAARKERLRPKYALPVANHGLSAYYGQSGINWMSQHTGIDFPVSYGTTVMAATDGTVRTQWNSAYGNMVIVTAKDGTETWYCHLSSYRVASGSTVKAGDPIAYSGNSGNSTGPHLHFEVRPGGGSSIDPLPWLRSHGLDPT
ncbi:M23 family metallopeptidase [Streptomyces sp. NPDC091281]|uniref:M23 family metallopeptidase n=1 Tax=Streptomyces sp. NPDC091281 TaxID=3365985 RepID=UPI00382E0DC7